MADAAYRIDIGRYKCMVFSDGTLKSDGEAYGLNNLVIDSGDHKILIDTGCGQGFQATAGRLVANLKAGGINRQDIDRIILTHGHVDHAAGTHESPGKPVFPNARYIVSAREWEYWEAGPGDNELQNFFFQAARKNLLPLRDIFDLVEDDAEVLPGINFMSAYGHTPGNVMVDIVSDEERLLCIGDIIHSQLEFENPEHLAMFDVTPEEAIATRVRILSDIAGSGVLVFACHFAFPGIGHIVRDKDIFAWQPV
jgi:glyoxylase-like metal-dependent hydrolase (beta-lactamase superfamily II)